MSDFKKFRNLIIKQLDDMSKMGDLYLVKDISDKVLVNDNLSTDSYPHRHLNVLAFNYSNFLSDGSIFRLRNEHDCTTCNLFIRDVGGVISIDDDLNVHTIWDVDAPKPYDGVAKFMSNLIKCKGVDTFFRTDLDRIGKPSNLDNTDLTYKWSHFYYDVNDKYKMDKSEVHGFKHKWKEAVSNFIRKRKEIRLEDIKYGLELLEDDLLELNDRNQKIPFVKKVIKALEDLSTIDEDKVELYIWKNIRHIPLSFYKDVVFARFISLLDEKGLDDAVATYMNDTDSVNNNRTNKIVTTKMKERANKELTELGYKNLNKVSSLNYGDVNKNNFIWSNTDNKKEEGLFGDLVDTTNKVKIKEDVTELTVDELVAKLTSENPNDYVENIEVLLDNKHKNKMAVLTKSECDKNPFKWKHPYAWTFTGNLVTDSEILNRVKAVGGLKDKDGKEVGYKFRVSLAWKNSYDDYDLHLIERDELNTISVDYIESFRIPSKEGTPIYFSNRKSNQGGYLDKDMNGSDENSLDAVENIRYPNVPRDGRYDIYIHNYRSKTGGKANEAIVELEYDNNIIRFVYPKIIGNRENIKILTVIFEDGKMAFEDINEHVTKEEVNSEIWGLNTNEFHKCKTICYTPNYWDDNKGTKHIMFALDGCQSEEVRVIHNKFINDELRTHRKLLDSFGSNLLVKTDKDQIGGVTLNLDKRQSLNIKLDGRPYKII